MAYMYLIYGVNLAELFLPNKVYEFVFILCALAINQP